MTKENFQKTLGIRADSDLCEILEDPIERKISEKISCKFFLIKYEYDKNREYEFCETLLDSILLYALSKKERDEMSKLKNVRRRMNLAYSRFVKNKKDNKGGEFGEVILFHLLEVVENSVQVVNKMCLKTSNNMYFHGADAVHFGINGNLRVLYLGQSKIGKSFSKTMVDAIEDIEQFCIGPKQTFEVNLALDNLSDDLPDQMKEEIKRYLNPFKSDLRNFTQTYAIFLGFEKAVLKDLESSYSGQDLFDKVMYHYKMDIDSNIKAITEKIGSKPSLGNKRFLFYLLPFKDIDQIRNQFVEGLKK